MAIWISRPGDEVTSNHNNECGEETDRCLAFVSVRTVIEELIEICSFKFGELLLLMWVVNNLINQTAERQCMLKSE